MKKFDKTIDRLEDNLNPELHSDRHNLEAKGDTKPTTLKVDAIISRWIVLLSILLSSLNLLPIVKSGVYVSPSKIYVGKKLSGSDVTEVFSITNMHFWDTQVVTMRGDCGCTNLFPEGGKLPLKLRPFQTVRMHVSIDTSGFKGKTTKILSIGTSDFRSKYEFKMRSRLTDSTTRWISHQKRSAL